MVCSAGLAGGIFGGTVAVYALAPSAKLKRGAVRLAMHAGVSTLVSRSCLDRTARCRRIEAALNPLLHARHVRWALSSGGAAGRTQP